MRPSIAVYAACAAADTALATQPAASRWRAVTKPLLMPLLLATLRRRTPDAPPAGPALSVAGPAAPPKGEANAACQGGAAQGGECAQQLQASDAGAGSPAAPPADCDARARVWVRRALVCSWVGDVALLRPTPGALLAGMGGFWAAHACYLRAFAADGAGAWLRRNPYALGVALGAGGVVVGALARQAPGFERPVVIYGATITAMALAGVATGRPMVRAGVLLFCLSDTVLGMGQFAGLRSRAAGGLVMASYTVAQGLIAQAYASR